MPLESAPLALNANLALDASDHFLGDTIDAGPAELSDRIGASGSGLPLGRPHGSG